MTTSPRAEDRATDQREHRPASDSRIGPEGRSGETTTE